MLLLLLLLRHELLLLIILLLLLLLWGHEDPGDELGLCLVTLGLDVHRLRVGVFGDWERHALLEVA